MRALLISSDSNVHDVLTGALREQNLDTVSANTVAEALHTASEDRFSLVLCDETLSDGTGAMLAQQLRQTDTSWPIILLARNGDIASQIDALDRGVDEILHWPIDSGLLLAHVRSVVRRCAPGESAILRFDNLSFDLRSLEVRRGDATIGCTSREMAILEFLLRHPRRVITRGELVDAVWDASAPPESNVVEVFIARLRNKIDKPFPTPLIHTIVGRGYMLSDTRPGVSRLSA